MTRKTGAVAMRRGPGLWVQGLVCGAVVTLATPTALLIGVLLLPALIVSLTDGTEGRPVLRAVLLFGLAASVRPLLALWAGGHTMAASLDLLADIATPALAWSAQGVAWLLTQLLPLMVRVALETQSRVEIARLCAQRARLEAEWGVPPADGGAA